MRRLLLAVAALAIELGAHAAHFRWTSQVDANSMDPHAASEPMSNGMNRMVYDTLVSRGRDLSLVPWLASSWERVSPTRWVFHLRPDVRFHDGSALTADDVVFSFARARQSGGTYAVFARDAGTATQAGAHTVEFATAVPNPALAESVAAIPIMSRAWCEKHGVTRPQNYRGKEETYAVRNAMGTGPYILVKRDVGVKTLHRRNPEWWGNREGLYEGNLDTVEYLPIASAATRMAALKAGQVDFVLDPAVQDVGAFRGDADVRVWDGEEIRVVFIGLDQERAQLQHSNVAGRNPFKDRRVRQALAHAIDAEALRTHVMRGLSVPTSIPLNDPRGLGAPALSDGASLYAPERARELLAQAGYPGGFSFTLHCTTDRLVNDEKLCVALAAMWARVGVDVKVEALPRAVFSRLAYDRRVSAFLASYGGSTDPIFMLKTVLRGPRADGGGEMNFGNARNDALDALIDRIETEMDGGVRRELLRRAVRLMQEEMHVIPLHRQVTSWASRRNVTVVHTPSNVMNPLWVRVD